LVRGGRPSADGGFYHGLKIVNLTEEQKAIVFSMLKDHAAVRSA
jgi:hypothetical protein